MKLEDVCIKPDSNSFICGFALRPPLEFMLSSVNSPSHTAVVRIFSASLHGDIYVQTFALIKDQLKTGNLSRNSHCGKTSWQAMRDGWMKMDSEKIRGGTTVTEMAE